MMKPLITEGPAPAAAEVFGSGGRVGYIAPSTCERLPREFYETVPPDVALLISTLTISQINQDHVDHALTGIERSARHLAATGADVVYAAGLPLVLAGGTAADRRLKERLEDATGLPCMTDLANIFDAYRTVGIDQIVLVSPFPNHVNEQIVNAFAEGGIRILTHRGFGLDRQIDYQRLPLDAPRPALAELFAEHPEAQGAFLACGRFGYVNDVTDLEETFGRPILLANQVMIWWALKSFGLTAVTDNCGSLITGLGKR